MIIEHKAGNVQAVINDEAFVIFETGEQTPKKVQEAIDQLKRLSVYEGEVAKAREKLGAKKPAPKKKAPVVKKETETPAPVTKPLVFTEVIGGGQGDDLPQSSEPVTSF